MHARISTVGAAFAALLLGSVAAQPARAVPPTPTPFSGFYIGAGIGGSQFADRGTLFEDRGAGAFDRLTSSNGIQSFAGGFFGGWGVTFSRWYVGAEADFWFLTGSDTIQLQDDTASTDPVDQPGDLMRARARYSFGLSGRVGYLIDPRVLAFLRLGWQRTQFSYSVDTFGDGVFASAQASERRWHDGFRLGIGAEAAVTPNVLVRLEGGHVWYDSATLNFASTGGDPMSASYRPRETYLRLGGAWRFGDMRGVSGSIFDTPITGPSNLTGFFVGGFVGGSNITVRSIVDKTDEADRFTGHQGNLGFMGGFYGGWGTVVGQRIYLGAEADFTFLSGSDSSVGSNENTPSGVEIRSEPRYRFGLSGRVGYLLSRDTMAYLRLGWQRARFRYSLADPDGVFYDSTASTTTSKWHNGFRLGVGVDAAVTPMIIVRGETGYIWYGSSSFTVADNNGDPFSVSMRPREAYLRVGAAVRF